MARKFAETYSLRSDDPVMDGRRCWLQKVRKSADLVVIAQALKPMKKGFPHVETILATDHG